MFNSGIRGKRATDNQATINPQNKFIQTVYPQPYISGYAISGSDDTALDPAGGQTVLVNGTGFIAGVSATLAGTQIASVTLVSSTQISFTSPAKAGGSYSLLVYNSTGGAAILVPGLTYSSVPTYTTAAGSIGSFYETTPISTSVLATSDSAITYSLSSGSLPSGATLYGNGVITGTSPVDSSSTTYTFNITATDAELQDVTRTFTLTINTDVVSWSTPGAGTNYSVLGNSPMSNVALSATSAAGYDVTYAANALPTGLTLSGSTISGTPTVEQTVSTLLTATANTSSRTSTRTISWTVTFGDTYWKYTSLLLSATTPTTTFINDASLNNNQLTIFGDTKPNNFNPYQEGYYSNFFDGTGDYLSIPTNSALELGSGDYTIEGWWYFTDTSNQALVSKYNASGGYVVQYQSNNLRMVLNTGGAGQDVVYSFSWTPVASVWYHIAITRSGTNGRAFINGVQIGTTTTFTTLNAGTSTPLQIGSTQTVTELTRGYVSNLRIVKGTAVYTSNFTPPTSPLTAIANTSLLTCQSNRLIDDSINNFTITKVGDTRVSPAIPFGTPTTASYNTLYSTSFDGTGDYLTLSNNTLLGMGSGNFTIEFWMYQTALSNYRQILDVLDGNSVGRLILWVGSDGTLTNLGQSGNQRHSTASGAIVINTWTHVALVRSSGTTKFYINGTQSGSNYTDSTNYTCTTGTVYIGINSDGSTYPYIGYLSNFRMVKGTAVYTSAFTPPTTSLTAIANTSLLTCQNATLIDNSTNNFTITSFNQAQPIPVSPFTMTTSNVTVTSLGSAYFDGTGDYLSNSTAGVTNFGTGDFTVEYWLYYTSTINSNYQQHVGSATTSTGIGFGTGASGAVYATTSTIGYAASSAIVPNTWQHIAWTRASGTLKGFLNGVQVYSGSVTTDFNETGVGIGGSKTGSSLLAGGYISNARIVKGTAIYTANFTPPQQPLTSITNTQLLTCQYNGGANNNGFIDQSSFNNIIARNGNTTQGTFSPFSQTGWSNYFDGVGNYLSLADNTSFDFGAGNFTIEYWINLPNLTNAAYIYGQIASNTTLASRNVYDTVAATTGVISSRAVYGSTTLTISSIAGVQPGVWTHVAFVRDGVDLRQYINGVQQGTASISTNSINNSTSTFSIGRWGEFSGTGATCNLSNFRIVKGRCLYPNGTSFSPSTSPLTAVADTVLLTCQSNGFVDNSPNNQTITVVGTPSIQAYSPFGGVTSTPISYSVYFDGSGDYLQTATAIFGLGTIFTVEAWVYPSALVTGSIVFASTASGEFSLGYKSTTEFGVSSRGVAWLITSSTLPTLNAWNHIVVVRGGLSTNQTSLYINGNRVANTTVNNAFTTLSTWQVGYDSGGGGSTWPGYISNLRVVAGTDVYGYTNTTITPPTSPLTAIANTRLLTCQSQTMIDNSSNYFTITSNGDTKPRIFNPFGITNTTGVAYTPSVNGGSAYFDGSGDYLSTVSNAQFALSGNYTVELWVYSTITWAATTNFVNMNSGGFFLQYSSSSGLQIGVAGSSATATFATTLTINTWNHIAISRSSNSTKCFVNGTQVGSTSNDSTSYVQNGMYIGALWEGSQPLTGYMSNFRVVKGTAVYTSNFVPPITPLTNTATIGTSTYNSVLLINATSGGIIDYHGTNDLETVGNAQLAPQDPYSGSYYSNYFDGTGDYLSVPNNTAFDFGAGDFTIEFWYYTTAVSGAWYILGKGDAATVAGSSLAWYNGGTTWQFYYNGSSTLSITKPSIDVGQWTHISVVRSGGTITIYKNGTSFSTGSIGAGVINTTSSALFVGGYSNLTPFNGYVSNFRVVKGTAIVPPSGGPTGPLTAVSGTQLLTCQSNSFKDNSTNAFTITRNGDTKVQSVNPFQQNTGKSIYFDGTGDYLVAPANPSFDLSICDFTVELWMYLPVTNTYKGIWGVGVAGGKVGLGLQTSNNGTITFVYGNGSSTSFTTGTTVVQLGTWNYLAVSRSGSTTRFYINGILDSTTTASTFGSGSYSCYVGDGWGISSGNLINGAPITGYIEDFRITKGVARYTTTFTPPTTPFITN